ncbi:hypothetical protein CTAYLR_002225 [Chrysophaeum taylorii]|uniref:Uncharacterized protein n=1 Tax=Chrysophaeum taylorii TaxID=2483200 RepID=A0AAD7UPN9_9STRA|nr:hypothetical protein CTAYLR_002225 [Chrysophaeum taylorii]
MHSWVTENVGELENVPLDANIAPDPMPALEPRFSLMKGLTELEEDMVHYLRLMEPMVRDCAAPLALSDDEILRFSYRTRHSHSAPPE